MKKRILFFALFLAAVIAAVFLFQARDRQAPPEPEKAPPPEKAPRRTAYVWRSGAKQTYHLKMGATIRSDLLKSDGEAFKSVIEGRLNFRVYDVLPDRIRVGFQISPVTAAVQGRPVEDLKQVYSVFFLASFTPRGRPLDFHFPPDITLEQQTLLTEVIKSFQVVLPKAPAETWTVSEDNQTGTYEAVYRLGEKTDTLFKEKTRYTSVRDSAAGDRKPPAESQAAVTLSRYEIKLTPRLSWITAMRGEEEQAVSRDGKNLMMGRAAFLLEPAGPPKNDDLAIWKQGGQFEEIRAAFYAPPETPGEEESADPTREAIAPRVRLDPVLEAMNDPEGGRTRKKHQLRDLLLAQPDAAYELLEKLRRGEMTDQAVMDAINALELAGTPAAQEALSELLWDPTQSEMNRIRAAVALGGVDDPTDQTVSTLWQAYETRNDPGQADVANTAALALGVLGDTLQDTDSALLRRINDRFRANLAASSQADADVLLQAVGNTANNEFVNDIKPYLNAGDPNLRASAAFALRSMDDPRALSAMMRAAADDPDEKVRAAAALGLTYQQPDEWSIGRAGDLLLSEPAPKVRLNLARFLLAHQGDHPEAQAALRRLLDQEESDRVKNYVLKRLRR